MRLHIILPALFLAGLSTQALADIGRIKLASGAATILRGGESITAAPGIALHKGDTLITGKMAELVLLLMIIAVLLRGQTAALRSRIMRLMIQHIRASF